MKNSWLSRTSLIIFLLAISVSAAPRPILDNVFSGFREMQRVNLETAEARDVSTELAGRYRLLLPLGESLGFFGSPFDHFAEYLLASNSVFPIASVEAAGPAVPAAAAPTISTPPASQTVNVGQTATFFVVAAGTQPLRYRWQKNGASISGATSSSYTTNATRASDNGALFRVIVSNSVGSAFSSSATLSVNVPPAITVQPSNRTVVAGQTASFTVAANGTQPLNYQWLENGVPIGGANSPSYTTAPTAAGDNGATFSAVVSNVVGSVTTRAARLTVEVPPSIVAPPANVILLVGQKATFTVVAAGTSPLSYQWLKNGTAIGGARAASYTTPATSVSDNGSTFAVTVTNSFGKITSSAATLTIGSAPTITSQPASATVNAGQTATFSVVASGMPAPTYQWMENGSMIGGATSSTYTTPATSASDNASTFMVVASNAVGNTPSNIATLTVQVPPSITSQPENLTVTAGQPATFSVGAAGTSPLSYQWQENGSPIGANSSSYTTPATSVSDNGSTFAVVVTNPAGSMGSNAATLTVNPAPVGVSFVQGAYGSAGAGAASVSATFGGAQAAGDLNLVFIGWSDTAASVSSVTDSLGNTYFLAAGNAQLSGVATQSLYYATNIFPGAANGNVVTVAFSGAATNPDLRIVEYSGASEANPIDVAVGASGTGDTASASLATINLNDLIVASDFAQTATAGAGAGFDLRLTSQPDANVVEDESAATAGVYTASAGAQASSGWWLMNAAALNLAMNPGSAPSTAPGGLSAMAGSATQINLIWTASTPAANTSVTAYWIEQCQGVNCGNFTQIATTDGSTTMFSATSLVPGLPIVTGCGRPMRLEI